MDDACGKQPLVSMILCQDVHTSRQRARSVISSCRKISIAISTGSELDIGSEIDIIASVWLFMFVKWSVYSLPPENGHNEFPVAIARDNGSKTHDKIWLLNLDRCTVMDHNIQRSNEVSFD
jgi:hypothetical protein